MSTTIYQRILKASAIALALSVASLAQAATIQLSPSSTTVEPGQKVTITITVDPQNASIAAVDAQLSYPTSLLTPATFTFAPDWVGVSQAGYDQMSGGLVIKTAGYPGGITAPTVLGTLTFTAGAAGTAPVAVTNASLAYDSNGANRLSGAQGSATIAIASGSSAVTAETGSGSAPTIAQGEVLGASTSTADAAATQASTTPVAGDLSQAAAVADALGTGTSFDPAWLWGILIVIVLALIAWLVWGRTRRQP